MLNLEIILSKYILFFHIVPLKTLYIPTCWAAFSYQSWSLVLFFRNKEAILILLGEFYGVTKMGLKSSL